MNNHHIANIASLPLPLRKRIKFTINLKILLFLIFIITPLMMFQEFFIILSSNDKITSLTNTNLNLILTHFQDRYIFITYIAFIVITYTLLLIHFRPFNRYIIESDNLEKAQVIINKHVFIIILLIVSSILSTIPTLILDYNYIINLPTSILLIYTLFRIFWVSTIAILFIFYYLQLTTPIRETMNLYSFSSKDHSFYNRFKHIVICSLLLGEFLLMFFHLIILLQNAYSTQSSTTQIDAIFEWGFYLFSFCFILAVIIVYIDNRINYSIKIRIHKDVRELVNSGNLSAQSIYYEQNDLGLLISEYNHFITILKKDIFKIQQSTNTLSKENISLRTQTTELIQGMSNQEAYVTQMNIATNTTSTTIQRLSNDANTQYNTLAQEQENIKQLIIGTDNIINIFNEIIEEHSQSKISSEKALLTVDKYLEQSLLTSTHFANIDKKIHYAGQETEAINEVLKIIKTISEQTNLLSMSAAIEAAHGVHSGQGFTIVAGEIRKLANISHDSVDKISQRLTSITELIAESKKISHTILEVSETTIKSSKELKKSIQQVCDISNKLSQVSQEANTITKSQSVSIKKSQEVTLAMIEFLDSIQNNLKQESSSSIAISLNFRTITQNFRQVRASLYRMETSLEKLSIVERHLGYILEDFLIDNQPYSYKELTETTSSLTEKESSTGTEEIIILPDIKKNKMSSDHEEE